MKILYYCDCNGSPMHMWQTYHIINELFEYGIVVEQFNPLDFFSASEANESLLRRIELNDIDLFMTPHNEDKLFLSTINAIKLKAIPSLLICFDNLLIPYAHKNIAKYFDLVWLTSIETKCLFDSWGAKSIFLPYAANPFFFKPENHTDNGGICFVGTPYGSRVNTINTLTKNGIKVDLYSAIKNGSGMKKFAENKIAYVKPFVDLVKFSSGRKVIKGAIKQSLNKVDLFDDGNINYYPPIPFDELPRVYSKYALSIASTTARNTGVLDRPLPVVNLRSFEIPMSGGLQICLYNSELARYFEDGKEIVFYKNEDDFVKKSKFYSADEQRELRLEMKENARMRAVKEHSWKCRFDQVFSLLGIDVLL